MSMIRLLQTSHTHREGLVEHIMSYICVVYDSIVNGALRLVKYFALLNP